MTLDLSVLEGDFALQPANAGAMTGVPLCAPLGLFEEDPDNPRFEENAVEFELLVDDVRRRGILQPLVVCAQKDGRLRIRFGARRFRAAALAGLTEVPYVVTEDPRQLDDYAQVAENERHASLQPLELATFAVQKIAIGEAKVDVARKMGLHPSALTHLLCLVGDPPRFLLELYHSRRCRVPLYLYRLSRVWRMDPESVEAACKDVDAVSVALIDSLERAIRKAKSVKLPGVLSTPSGHGATLQANDRVANSTVDAVVAAELRLEGHAVRSRIKRPRLLGIWKNKEVELLVRVKPSSLGSAYILDISGKVELEVPIAEITLTALVEAK